VLVDYPVVDMVLAVVTIMAVAAALEAEAAIAADQAEHKTVVPVVAVVLTTVVAIRLIQAEFAVETVKLKLHTMWLRVPHLLLPMPVPLGGPDQHKPR
jgi:hypothetical protein